MTEQVVPTGPFADLRVLVPVRFDLLSRSMEQGPSAQWEGLARHCDVVYHSPGLSDHVDAPLDEVARHHDCDVILIPDNHHPMPGIYEWLWRGAGESAVPRAWFFGDIDAEVGPKLRLLETLRPSLVLTTYSHARMARYHATLAAIGARFEPIPFGYDDALFHPGTADRDVDILVCGAVFPEEVYPTRKRVQDVARGLAGRYRVLDLEHPGYWDSSPAVSHRAGQPTFAGLLQRSRLVVTGSGFGGVQKKYYEVAACGAVGIGDLPTGEPDAERFLEAMVVVDPAADDASVARQVCAALDDQAGLAARSGRAIAAAESCSWGERGANVAALLADLVPTRQRTRRGRPAEPAVLRLVAAVDPEGAPPPRRDWVDAWSGAPEGTSRTRAVAAAVAASTAEFVVVALHPENCLPCDARMVLEALRASDQAVAVRAARAARPGEAVASCGWTLAAARRAELGALLTDTGGRFGLEEAILVLADRGAVVLREAMYDDPASELARSAAVHATGGVPAAEPLVTALHVAAAAERLTLVRELAGLARLARGIAVAGLPDGAADEAAPRLADPELVAPVGAARFLAVDPSSEVDLDAVLAALELGQPIAIGIRATAGTAPTAAAEAIVAHLTAAGVDLDATPDIAVLERPLWDGECAFLNRAHARDGSCTWPTSSTAPAAHAA